MYSWYSTMKVSQVFSSVRPTSRGALSVARAVVKTREPRDPDFTLMREGVKNPAKETLITPRFYTTDWNEMNDMVSLEKNPTLSMEELTAVLGEFRKDYNQRHFVRNEGFRRAADKLQGQPRRDMVEFLERACTAEFSGFLVYKELSRCLKKSNPVVAEIFNLLSRDEARHAGFLNKALSDFDLSLDLGFLTQNRTYTFFRPKFILYAAFVSERIGYWRYITIYRNLQRNPDKQVYPMFEFFENWCQDENRHGDFLAALLKSRPELLTGWEARQWSRFFCLTVYITMYVNDHMRKTFYETVGLDTTEFNRHVITVTNGTVARLFPEVPDIDAPGFWDHLDSVVENNACLKTIEESQAHGFLKFFQKLPLLSRNAAAVLQLFLMPTLRRGSLDVEGAEQYQY